MMVKLSTGEEVPLETLKAMAEAENRLAPRVLKNNNKCPDCIEGYTAKSAWAICDCATTDVPMGVARAALDVEIDRIKGEARVEMAARRPAIENTEEKVNIVTEGIQYAKLTMKRHKADEPVSIAERKMAAAVLEMDDLILLMEKVMTQEEL